MRRPKTGAQNEISTHDFSKMHLIYTWYQANELLWILYCISNCLPPLLLCHSYFDGFQHPGHALTFDGVLAIRALELDCSSFGRSDAAPQGGSLYILGPPWNAGISQE